MKRYGGFALCLSHKPNSLDIIIYCRVFEPTKNLRTQVGIFFFDIWTETCNEISKLLCTHMTNNIRLRLGGWLWLKELAVVCNAL